MKDTINNFLNIGAKSSYLPWEKHLTRKLNAISLIGFFNMLVAMAFFVWLGFADFALVCVGGIIALIAVVALNYFKNYIWSAYTFFGYGFLGFFVPLNLVMGIDSYVGLFYFPVVISMILLLGKKETFTHLIILFFIGVLSVALIAAGYKYQLMNSPLDSDTLISIRMLMIILSITTITAFTSSIVFESIKQEELIKKMLTEKEILLAEVFHRVKNNMNIVTSLLNLKKNMSSSEEVKSALEDCRNRVFSMALVHQNIFNKNNVIELCFKTYIEQLTNEIALSFGNEKEVKINLDADHILLNISTAIPCGLIINELITNSFKYAQQQNSTLQINITAKQLQNKIALEIKDNGPGLPEGYNTKGSLGVELIKDLSEQINGAFSFKNENGLVFSLAF